MEEANSTKVNSFEQAMRGETPSEQPDTARSYSVNSTVESVLNVVAVIFLIVGVIGGVYLLVTSIEVVDRVQSPKLLFTSLLSGPVFFALLACFHGHVSKCS